MATYQAACLCGSVKLSVTGNPELMGYCHCDSCRRWSAGPVNAFTLWKPEAVRVTEGSDQLRSFNLTPASTRKWCARCGGHVLSEHPGLGMTDVYAALLPGLAFKPAIHVNYAETVLPIRDGLPKFKDFPKEVGGSGETVAE